MLTVLYIIACAFISLMSYACVAGAVRIILAARSGDKPKAKRILFSVVRVGLILAGLIVLVLTHGHGIKIAQILLIIMLTLGIPRDWRVLRGNGR